MRKVTDLKDYQRIQDDGVGYVYNDFSPSGSHGGDDNILHLASCRWLDLSNLNVDKYFFNTLIEAEIWLESHRGEEGESWRKCRTCLAAEG